MASHGHGVARSQQPRTPEQRQKELDKIKIYRDLTAQIRADVAAKSFTASTFALTSKLLRLNPEYYTIWNVRRRSLISGLFSKPLDGSWPSMELSSSSPITTTTASSDASLSSSTDTTRASRDRRIIGQSGTTAEDEGGDRTTGEQETSQTKAAKQMREEAEVQDLEVIKSELAFTIPLLIEFPKCYWIWKYRLWLLQQAIERLSLPVARQVWEEELGLVSKMLGRDRRNFHAWGYRRHVVAKLESEVLNGQSLVQPEFEYTTKMIKQDLSNFSAWHNRSKLIPRLLLERQTDGAGRRKFFDDELDLIKNALNVGPDDQSLWNYHQYLMLELMDSKSPMTRDLTAQERIKYLETEIADAQELLEDYGDYKLIYEAVVDYRITLLNLEKRPPDKKEANELLEYLGKVRTLDPMRSGRWNDLAENPRFEQSA